MKAFKTAFPLSRLHSLTVPESARPGRSNVQTTAIFRSFHTVAALNLIRPVLIRETALIGALLCAFALLTTAGAQSLLITTVAGYAGKGSFNGTSSNALFLNPQAVAFDAATNLYVADSGNNTIRMITPAGVASTLAGTAGATGSADGLGSAASFYTPAGMAVDASTNIYVCDYGNNTIRLVTSAGQVTTIAGQAGVAGSVNGTGTNALFNHPLGLTIDTAGTLYVADYGNHLIRKILAGTHAVSTLAGSAGVFGYANATGTNALFYEPEALVADLAGNIYVADTGNAVIRAITPGGVVTTLAGSAGILGSTDATGTNALFYQPAGITINSATNLFVSDYFNNTVRQISPAGIVSTLAGLAGTLGSTDGTNHAARFMAPQGLAVKGIGPVYLADCGNSTIRAISTNGVVTTFAGSPSGGGANGLTPSARFYGPRQIAVDSGHNVYVADTLNHVIRKISASGVVGTLAGTVGVAGSEDGVASSALFAGPQGMAVDASGNVYVADTGNSTIREISASGTVSTIAGSAGNPGNADGTGTAAQFSSPTGIAVDGFGNLYVADTGNHTLRKIASGGVVTTLAGLAGTPGSFDGTGSAARFNAPAGVTVDSSGNIYVSDRNNHLVREVTSSGVVTTLAGWPGITGATDGTNGNALFDYPAGIGVDGSGNLYVSDSGNQIVRKISPSGGNWVVTTVAGQGGVNGASDGTGTAAHFNYPAGIAVDGGGYLFIADSANNTVRSQAIPPIILTQPQSQTNALGTPATFTVSAYGSSPFTYTWKYSGTNYSSSSGNSLVVSYAGTYAVLVSNIVGTLLSSNATLTLTNSAGGPGFLGGITVSPAHASTLLNLSGTSYAVYTLQASTNLVNWVNLTTFTMTNGSLQYLDTTSSNFPIRFYKLASP